LLFRSIGTKGLEAELQRLFPDARIARFDRDTEALARPDKQFHALKSGEIDIVIGTQMISKGFDLPKLSVVGIIQADSSLQLPDYTAAEKTYQLVSQVAGRVDRGFRDSMLFVQTYHPTSPLLAWSLGKDYAAFYEHELHDRQLFRFPPYSQLLKLIVNRASQRAAEKACHDLYELISENVAGISISQPAPAFKERLGNRYFWQLVIRSKQRTPLQEVIKLLPHNVRYDLDPSDLL
jgi:primosomal protein N' (replication factor Y)